MILLLILLLAARSPKVFFLRPLPPPKKIAAGKKRERREKSSPYMDPALPRVSQDLANNHPVATMTLPSAPPHMQRNCIFSSLSKAAI